MLHANSDGHHVFSVRNSTTVTSKRTVSATESGPALSPDRIERLEKSVRTRRVRGALHRGHSTWSRLLQTAFGRCIVRSQRVYPMRAL